ncbi:Zn2-C6 fungal-type domain-containing protein [Fusarium acuminatum]|uniref:Zn2-C6 fungal-type domain-containing protein n=1 Tax=Fusarium acuminatum TaxID=5515 RepID=A0ABZ2WZJ2_9HYPO
MAGPLVTRRNGKTQACEPCRRRKVACDHSYPVCRRCRRKPNGEANCYYATASQDASTPGLSQRPENGTSLGAATPREPLLQSGHFGPDDRLWSSPAARAPLGFFGPTSFPAAYEETETSLAAQLTRGENVPPSPSCTTAPSRVDIQNMVNMDQGANWLAIRVLQAIPEKPFSDSFHSHASSDGWVRKIGERLITSTWETFGSYLRDRGNVIKLRELGSMICINTRRSLKEDQDDPQAWIETFSGSNLRWEAIGMMFLYAALGELSASMTAESRKVLEHYTEFCSSCITLANMGGSSGSLMLFLMYKRSVLHACMHGETSLPYWKFHAETVAMLTFSGFHDNRPRDASGTSSEPTVATEIRRRVGCQIFVVDKFLATLVGRPPLLTRRFCCIKPPLDLDDSALLSDKEMFRTRVQGLDSDGWETDGRFHSTTLLRVRMMVALIRDEILEAVLSQTGECTFEHLMSLKVKELELYHTLPAHVICSRTLDEIRNINLHSDYPKLLTRLDHLLNLFLVERALVKQGHSRVDLLTISFEMVVLTLSLWTQKHVWAGIQGESQWIIMGYATLAGAVLCLELMDSDPVIITPGNNVIAGETCSRSSIIQQLSLLVGCLSASNSSQPNSSISQNVRAVIKKVLDHILNNPSIPPATIGFEGFDFTADWDTFAQFNLLDDFDWLSQDREMEDSRGLQ